MVLITFNTKFVLEPKGNLEFFQRTVFAAFDTDNNGVIDDTELDVFVNIFYAADSIFAGDARLPDDKNELKSSIQKNFDQNHDGNLTFEEIRPIISGQVTVIV